MKPTQEQVIAWAREICGPEMPEWRDGTEMEWHEFHALALRCYEAGRKDENEECENLCKEPEIEKRNLDCGKLGWAVAHYEEIKRPKTARECAHAIRARREQ
jgi:hypothetical protein